MGQFRRWRVASAWLVLLGAGGALLLGAAAQGATITVDDSYAGDNPPAREWTTIQEGVVDAAPGDTVFVFDGTYAEGVTVANSSITIEGETRTGVVVSQATGAGARVFSVLASGFVLRNVSVQGGDYGVFTSNAAASGATLENVTVSGSGFDCVRIGNAAGWTLRDVSLTGCFLGLRAVSADYGALDRVTISGNSGGGVYFQTSSFWRWRSVNNSNTAEPVDFYYSPPAALSNYQHDIDTSNLVGGAPVVYFSNASGSPYSGPAGWLAAVNSSGLTVALNTTISGLKRGAFLFQTSGSTFTNVNSSLNEVNFLLDASSNNTFWNSSTTGLRALGSVSVQLRNSPFNRFDGGRWASETAYSHTALATTANTANHNNTVANLSCIGWNTCFDLMSGSEGFRAFRDIVRDNAWGLQAAYSGSITVDASTFTSSFYYHVYASASFSTPFDRLVVRNSTFNGTTGYYAVLLAYGRFAVFDNNSFAGADDSLHFTYSNQSRVQNNTFVDHRTCAVNAAWTDYIGMFGNNFTGGTCAVRWQESSFWTLRSNTLPNMTDAFQHRVGATPMHSAYMHDADTSNVLNGRPILYAVNATSVSFSGNYSWIALVNSTNITVTSSGNVSRNEWGLFAFDLNDSTVYGFNLTTNGYGLAMFDSFRNTVRDLRSERNSIGAFYVVRSSLNTFLRDVGRPLSAGSTIGIDFDEAGGNNTVEQADLQGFQTCLRTDYDTNFVSLLNSTLQGCSSGVDSQSEFGLRVEFDSIQGATSRGVYIQGASFRSTKSFRIANSTFNGSYDAVYILYGGGGQVADNTITNSTNAAVAHYQSTGATVQRNAVRFANYGWYLSSSSTNNFTRNNVSNATTAMYFTGGSNTNRVYGNSFTLVNGSVVDGGTGNAFDNGYAAGGNYWSNGTHEDQYRGSSQTQDGADGIQDTPQGVYGSSRDNYPIVEPLPPRLVLVSPANGSLVLGGSTLVFNVSLLFDSVQYSLNNGSSATFSAPFNLSVPSNLDGPLFVRIWANDSVWDGLAPTFLFDVDSSAPNISLDGPAAGGWYPAGTQFNFTVSDLHLASNATWSNGSANNSLPSPFDVSTTGWADGAYNLTITAWDTVGQRRVATFSFRIDSTPPAISLVSPANGSVVRAGVGLRFNITDAALGAVASSNGSGAVSFAAPFNLSTAGWADGSYSVTITALDLAGNAAAAAFTVVIDSTPPTITLDAPANGSVIRAGTQLNFTLVDANLGLALWNNGSGGVALGAPWDVPTAGWPDGQYDLILTASDAAGNVRTDVFNFTIDSSDPVVTLVSPANGSVVRAGTVLDFEVLEPNLLFATVDIGPGPGPFTAPWNVSTTGLPDGTWRVAIVAVDAAQNRRVALFTFFVDSTPPSITISPTPSANATVLPVGVVFDLNVSDASLLSVWWSDGSASTPLAFPFNISTNGWADGHYTLTAFADDRAGNAANLTWSFWLDGTDPVIALVSPANGSVVQRGTLLNLSINDSNLELAYYLLTPDFTAQNPRSLVSPFDIDTALWSEQDFRLQVFASDLAGNSALLDFSITIDSTPPNISLVALGQGRVDYRYALDYPAYDFIGGFHTGVRFDVSISEPHPTGAMFWNATARWYEPLASPYDITITSGWGEGRFSAEVRMYDAAGNLGNRSWSFVIDNTDPVITLTSPADRAVIRTGQIIDFAVNDSNVASAVYRLTPDLFGQNPRFLDGSFDTVADQWGEGSYQIDLQVCDVANNCPWRSFNFTVDNTPPTISVSPVGSGHADPFFGDGFHHDLGSFAPGLLLDINVSDAHMLGVTYWNATSRFYDVLAAPYDLAITAGWGEGAFYIDVVAEDQAFNRANLSWTFTIDGTPPLLRLERPSNGSFMSPGQPIELRISDPGLATPHFRITPDPLMLSPGELRPFGEFYYIESSQWSDGLYAFQVTACDGALNCADLWFNITMDGNAPTIELRAPTNGSALAAGATLNFSISDLSVFDATWDTGSGPTPLPAPYLINTTGWAPGHYTVVITARDHFQHNATRSFEFDIRAPPAGEDSVDVLPIFLAVFLMIGGAAAAALFLAKRGRGA